ncbi:hypothetical protein DF3PB_50005 [uncultured Defluviicoccus sp.]|uniref:Uncharacterized protein n=1 Tax=metagenome TaxID=256318 RepID=A0A380TH39_9ZZZZ|nr:hypothetical protein DF3PB_50005 [uncultured Defluviicoccus sp.]
MATGSSPGLRVLQREGQAEPNWIRKSLIEIKDKIWVTYRLESAATRHHGDGAGHRSVIIDRT